ncbi:MAG: hypothetical protein KC518_05255, partial [Candidatus Cloacimonetes bacterium]|nr:hypothetical protein [Candidatus Cloacimonadota bacterium]
MKTENTFRTLRMGLVLATAGLMAASLQAKEDDSRYEPVIRKDEPVSRNVSADCERPTLDLRVHRVGKMWMTFKNDGTFG